VPDVYTHGHHESVLRSHRWRTAQNSAAYLLDELHPGQRLLDVGCGPGTITADLAGRVVGGDGTGGVIGIDASTEVVRSAAAQAGDAAFGVADLYRLPFAAARFDVVHIHQVLQHLRQPVEALVEARRVLAPGGVLAVRESDYGGFFWSPPDPRLDRWLELYHEVTARNGAEADAGRVLSGWVRAAGFVERHVTGSVWTFADAETRQWWGSLWADRVVASDFGHQALAYGLSDPEELETIASAWREWAAGPDAMFVTPHVEVLARCP
jgi:ubiquinone/menaquinone biosynthesis C-methylase UbiE